ncbi:FixH family protein [Bradyrhizobium sp.]|uniref:FixH family protein n=1 Tax=Bradyrhizobium sp. TaxID=376 RepID=UPI003C428884
MMPTQNAIRPITGRFVLIAVGSFFLVVIGVNVVMMRLAISTLPGTEVESTYGASLAYQKEIEAAHEQDARGWKVDAHVERQPDGAATLIVQAKDASGRSLTGLALSGHLARPTDRRADQALSVVESGGGIYRGAAHGVAPGQWDLVIEADADGKRLFLSHNRIVLN